MSGQGCGLGRRQQGEGPLWLLTGPVGLDYMVELVSARLFHCEVTIFSFSYSVIWSKLSPHSTGEKTCSTSWKLYRYYFEFFPKKDFSSPLPFISISVDPCLYLSYLLGYNSVLSYLFCCSDCPVLAIGNSSRWASVSMTSLILLFFFLFLSISFVSGTAQC